MAPFIVFYMALATYLKRTGGNSRFTIGVPVFNRMNNTFKKTSGMFVSTIPFTGKIFEDWSSNDFNEHIEENWLELLRHQRFPFSLMQELRNTDSPIFNIMLSYQDNKIYKSDDESLCFSGSWHYAGFQAEQLCIHMLSVEDNRKYSVDYDYLAQIFSDNEIEILHKSLCNILSDALKSPDKPISNLKLTDTAEFERVVYTFNYTIRELITLADAEMVFTSMTYYPICLPLLTQGNISELAIMNTDENSDVPQSIDEFLKLGEGLADTDITINSDDTVAIMFTSGTTSSSKPVMLSHRNLLHNASNSIAAVDIKNNTFTALPFYHSYGLTCAVLNGLTKGVRLTINGNTKTMMRDLLLSNSETFMAVPLLAETLYRMLWAGIEKSGEAERVRTLLKRHLTLKKIGINSANSTLVSIKEKILGSIILVITGGAPLNPDVGRNLGAFGVLVV